MNTESSRYIEGLRATADWLEGRHDLPVMPIVSPARNIACAVTLFWQLLWHPADFTIAATIVDILEKRSNVVGWRKFNTDVNKVTICAVERSIPAGIYITLRATDESVVGPPRDFTQMGVDFR